MSCLQLDARQRAMLQEMGLRVWAPTPRPAPQPAPRPDAPLAPQAADAAALAPPGAHSAGPAADPAPGDGAALLHAPLALYPGAAPDSGAAGRWLLLLDCADPQQPLAGDAGALLANMLRALGLNGGPVFAAPLHRDAHSGASALTLAQALAQTRPAVVVALGLAAARVLRAQNEPLGRLRAQTHVLADGTPAVVSYDPAYLLRAPEAKAAAWADLCRALAHAPGQTVQ